MKKFLVVGVGGSGGATVRYLMDQLRADLRSRGVHELPAAWQFVQVDVNPVAERTPGLGSVQDLGGTYVPVSTAGNTFRSVRTSVEDRLARSGHLDGLLGVSLSPRDQSDYVPVATGAGQFRAVGRMLTLTRLDEIQGALNRSWQALQQASPWGELPYRLPEQGPYDSSASVVPIVIGSMAGGSGASMFLDVCRVMGRISGLDRKLLGVYLFSPDVFSSLDPEKRKGIDGNAIAALGELMASQTRVSDVIDNDLLVALGMAPEPSVDRAFGRVFPIGAMIGGDGARFGEDADDIFRGLGRALSATMLSDQASRQYLQNRFENPLAPSQGREVLGWGCDPAEVSWGSFGYASLSLGRDRYAEYVAQRLSRIAVDRLVDGYHNPTSEVPALDQLDQLVNNQWSTIIERLGLPPRGTKAREWLVAGPLPRRVQRDAAEGAVGAVLRSLDTIAAPNGGAWLDLVHQRLQGEQDGAAQALQSAAYQWAESQAVDFERRLRDEVLRLLAHPHQGLAYARRVLERLADDLAHLLELLGDATAPSATPLTLKADFADRVRKADVSSHVVGEVREKFLDSAQGNFVRACARLTAGVLKSFADDVLPALRQTVGHALENLEAARRTTEHQAGLAQLHTTIYQEWPADSTVVPPRFDHAQNEVLLTTSADFPMRFGEHVREAASDGVESTGVATMVEEIVRGHWDTVGSEPATFPVLTTEVAWRAPVLPRDALTGQPTPSSKPVYALALTTAAILDRATAYQARKDFPFERYSSETFAGYLDQVGIADAERERRRKVLVEKFIEAIAKAYPLVGVNREMVQRLHGSPLRIELTFGDIPLAPGSAAANDVRAVLETIQDLEIQSLDRFDGALTAASPTSRVAIYGAYPKYFPLVFSSFLLQLKEHWGSQSEEGMRELWKWKRTRPLPAAIGMGRQEQTAMIKGWYLGRALGLVNQPAPGNVTDPVQVFDRTTSQWDAFAKRQLTAREHYRNPDGFDWLAGVLEGHTLAVVNTANDSSWKQLRPYQTLRRIFDDGVDPSATGFTSADRLVADWLRTGQSPSGEPSGISVINNAAPNPESRAAALVEWLGSVRSYVADRFLTPPSGPGVLATWRRNVPTADHVDTAPMFAEIALEVHSALGELEQVVRRTLATVESQGGSHGVPEV